VTTTLADAEKEIGGNDLFFICQNNVPIGVISYRCFGSFRGYISEFALVEEARGKGIGSKVLQEVLMLFKDLQRVDLWTHPENPARTLYERFGFTPEDEPVPAFFGLGTGPRQRMVWTERKKALA
jgi:ribosomal protein S18 acetylase RimI-like enzyme